MELTDKRQITSPTRPLDEAVPAFIELLSHGITDSLGYPWTPPDANTRT